MKKPVRRVLIANGKYKNLYYDVEASGGFEHVCLDLFRRRDAEWIYPTSDPTPPEPPRIIPDTDDPELLAFQKVRWNKYEAALKDYTNSIRSFAVMRRARAGDANAASWIIRARKDIEYEGFEIEELIMLEHSIEVKNEGGGA